MRQKPARQKRPDNAHDDIADEAEAEPFDDKSCKKAGNAANISQMMIDSVVIASLPSSVSEDARASARHAG